MAVTEQSGGQSMMWMGRQTAVGTAITAAPAAHALADTAGKIINARFPFTSLGLDLAAEQAESASITGGDASTKRAGGQLWSEGTIEVEVLPTQLLHFLRPIFNVEPTIYGADGTTSTTFSARGTAEKTLSAKNRKTGNAPANVTVAHDGDTTITATPVAGDADDGVASFEVPCQITAELANARSGSTMTVEGFRRIGLPNDEVITLVKTYQVGGTGGDANKIFSTPEYYDGWSKITITGTGVSSGDLLASSLSYETGTYRTRLGGFGSSISNGMTVMMRKGLMPVVAQDVHFNNSTLTVGDDVRFSFESLGGKIFNRRLINTGVAEHLTVPDTWTSDTNYPLGDLNFQPSWGCSFQFGDDSVDMTGVTVNLNLNLESRASFTGSRYRSRPRKSATPRQVTTTPSVFFEYGTDAEDMFLKWQDIYIDNALEECELLMYNWLDNGKEHSIQMTMPANQLIEVPAITVDDSSDIERTLSLLAIPNSTGPSNEISVDVYSDRYEE